ncbi:TRAP transporter permease [Halovivax cerinus]|uniref:TRAP transporter permease n=1 Tax=Halovivax cerinus TaxID=1487865 RepID=A0ABD5NI08_9EURY|nr:TRAP transporter fused permease subunit [Halovivax cerinus]
MTTDDHADSGTDGPTADRGDADEPTDEVSPEEADDLIDEIERRRSLSSVATVVVATIGITFSVFQLILAARSTSFSVPLVTLDGWRPAITSWDVTLQLLQANAVHVSFALVLTFLLFPGSMGDGVVARNLGRIVPAASRTLGEGHPITRLLGRARAVVRWLFVDPDRERVTPFDLLCLGASILPPIFFLTEFDEIQNLRVFGLTAGRPVTEVYSFLEPVLGSVPFVSEYSYAMVLGVVGILLVLEATRRTLGLPLTVIVASFIVYARWGYLIDGGAPVVGVLAIPELTWPQIVQNLWYNVENGVFGIPVTVSVQFIYIFILFGAFLEMSGAGQWFIDLAYAATGKRRGGPAKASILSSGFMGTISGSSIANTVTTGAFTIPLMKRSGYSPEFAGGVESSASSGGQILPPVMGAAAFLMVQYTGTPFREIIVLATIPALVFFFGVWVMVHLKAIEEGIGGATPDTVAMGTHLRGGWFYLVPIVLLLYYLIVARLTVARSAWFTLVALVALIALVSAYSEETRVRLVAILVAVVGVELASYVAAGVSVAGLVTGAGGAGMPVGTAIDVVGSRLGWYAMLAGVVTLLSRPDVDPPLLELDPTVQTTVDAVGDRIDRLTASTETRFSGRGGAGARVASGAEQILGDVRANQPFRFGTFVFKSMDEGARTAVPVVIAVAAAGVIPGVISVTGLGPNLTSLLLTLSGGSIVIMLLVTAVACIVLGMGMPTTVTYIILVSMLASPLVEFGIPLLAAHLFILYFGVIADITPPVAVAAYAASGVAKSDPFETGVKAFSLSLNKAMVPFAFVFVPGIVLLREKANAAELDPGEQYRVIGFGDLAELSYSVPEVILPVLGVFLGVVALGAAVIGTLYARVDRPGRAAFALSSILLVAPQLISSSVFDLVALAGVTVSVDAILLDLTLRGVGLVVFAAVAAKNRREATDLHDVPAPAAG